MEITVHDDGTLDVRARAAVPSLGWGAPELVPYSLAVPPRDGIYELDFLAQAPERGAASVIDMVVAELRLPLPPSAKGVRVHGSVNSMVGLVLEGRLAR